VDHPAKELDSRTKASVVFWESEERWQLAKHNILDKLPTIAGWCLRSPENVFR